MTDLDTKELAGRFIQVWSAGNLELLDELADPEIVVSYAHFGEPVRGREAFRGVLEQTFHHFPDLRTEPRTILGGPGGAMVEWVYEGTHRNGELFGVEPAGTQVRVQGITVYEIADGRIVEERGIVDVLAMMAQLGAM